MVRVVTRTCCNKVMVVRLVPSELTCGLSLDDHLKLDRFSISKVVNLVSVVEILNGKWMLMTYMYMYVGII